MMLRVLKSRDNAPCVVEKVHASHGYASTNQFLLNIPVGTGTEEREGFVSSKCVETQETGRGLN